MDLCGFSGGMALQLNTPEEGLPYITYTVSQKLRQGGLGTHVYKSLVLKGPEILYIGSCTSLGSDLDTSITPPIRNQFIP